MLWTDTTRLVTACAASGLLIAGASQVQAQVLESGGAFLVEAEDADVIGPSFPSMNTGGENVDYQWTIETPDYFPTGRPLYDGASGDTFMYAGPQSPNPSFQGASPSVQPGVEAGGIIGNTPYFYFDFTTSATGAGDYQIWHRQAVDNGGQAAYNNGLQPNDNSADSFFNSIDNLDDGIDPLGDALAVNDHGMSGGPWETAGGTPIGWVWWNPVGVTLEASTNYRYIVGMREDGNMIDQIYFTMNGDDPGAAITGDLNGDGFVGQDDLNIVLGAWGTNVTPGDPLAGDPSGDGFVGQDDLNDVLAGWGQGTPPSGLVPEPASAALLALGGLAMLRRRR